LSGTSAGTGVDGLLITAGDSTVKGLAINQFQLLVDSTGKRIGGSGIHLMGAGGNVIQDDYLGPDTTASSRVGNGRTGIFIDGSPDNLIGGPITQPGSLPGEAPGNIISSNRTAGIFIQGAGATGNVVQGNTIGTNADHDNSGNLANLIDGIEINGASGNTVGGTGNGDGNVIGGNLGNGISIRGPRASANTVQGNFIGTDPVHDGTALGNLLDGIFIDGATNNLIGGTTPGAQNVIVLNRIGVDVEPSTDNPDILPVPATGNVIPGNDIGLAFVGARQ
jgi:hypothetical protein